MEWNTFTSVFISSAVAAAAVAAIANVVVSILNNRRLKAIEVDKRNNELIQYRYTKLYALLEKIKSFERPTAGLALSNETRGKFIQMRSDLYNNLTNEYKLAKPLIDKEVRIAVEELNKQIVKILASVIESDNNLPIGEHKKVLILIINYESELEKCIIQQLEMLLQNK